MVKKQTVWLLTMLSLLIVLSVYYMTSPENGEMAFIQEEDWAEMTSEEAEGENVETAGDGTVISQISTDELFSAIRLDMKNQRDQVQEQLSEIVASSDFTTEEKNEALEKMETIKTNQSKESIIENTILASAQYDDVLVRAEDDVVHVTVKAQELSKEETNQIIQMVSDEFGHKQVQVQFQPAG
ncbi:SpoIIIAH-like family protein [Halobacillus kuroshimensis]|uniref:SpoIIIAH-like family protein n=1 Tax=Halobacillus kuroshimensis TaxID=302481 RepID=A0ABS3DZG4_9BACI|nr:SpoIIIAH-like family protein [Halobacillus kuroshimensis]MBN8236589.1 SpoIIIAH-like family protein [Halobacillus kuroshimensis]